MNVIDIFSGVGGFSSGFIKEKFDVVLANEIDKTISESYTLNHPNTLMINKDIKDLISDFDYIVDDELNNFKDKNRALEIRNKLKNIEVIIGGPPCQGFSMAGARIRKTHEFIEDPRNYLFKYYFKMIQKFEPEYFVFENVQGLFTIQQGDLLKEIVNIFEEKTNFTFGGYNVNVHLVDVSKFGVPQKRKRLIILGSKKYDVDLSKKLNEYIEDNNINEVTLRDAISDLNYLNSGEGCYNSVYKIKAKSGYQEQRRKNSKTLFNHVAPNHSEKTLSRIKEIKSGQNFRSLADYKEIKSVHSGAYGRLEWNKPSYTITTRFDTPSAGRVIHPELNRALTPREAARIQSFDDDFIFTGSKSSVGKQIGNAVPPLLARALASIIKNIKGE